MSPVCVEIYIFRGSVSFLMFKVILDSIPTHSCYCYFYYWPQHRIEYLIMGIGDQNSKQPMPRFDKKKQRSKPFSKKRTSAKKSVQKISCCFKFVLFLSFLLPPLSPVWHRTIWKKEISNMWFCSLVVFAYLALFFVDDWSVPHTWSHLVTPVHTWSYLLNGPHQNPVWSAHVHY